MLLFILGLICFQLLIILHEYGHYLVARRNRVEVEEFGLGFPPKLVGRTFGRGIWRCHYSLNWLPLGGFVRLKGENDEARGPGTYGAASLWVKTKITLAGVAVNFSLAIVLFTFLALVGIPRLLPATTDGGQFTVAADTTVIDSRLLVADLAQDSPAVRGGLGIGDRLTAIGGVPVASQAQLNSELAARAGQTVDLVIERNGQTRTSPVELRSAEAVAASRRARNICLETQGQDCPLSQGYLGVVAVDFVLQRSTWSAPITGVGVALQYTKLTLVRPWGAGLVRC